MSDLTAFDFGGRTVRTAGTAESPLFCAADVCEALGIANTSDACERLDDDEKTRIVSTESGGIPRTYVYVNEPGIYSLIGSSRKPEAKAFKRWINHEVLPQIRKTGQYSRKLTAIEVLAEQANALVQIERAQAEHERRLAAMEADQLRRDEEAKAVGALPPAPVDVSERSYGQMALALLNTFASKNNGQFQSAYRAFYQAVYERPETRIDLRARLENAKAARARGAKEPRLSDVIDSTGKGAEIYAIARQLFARAA